MFLGLEGINGFFILGVSCVPALSPFGGGCTASRNTAVSGDAVLGGTTVRLITFFSAIGLAGVRGLIGRLLTGVDQRSFLESRFLAVLFDSVVARPPSLAVPGSWLAGI